MIEEKCFHNVPNGFRGCLDLGPKYANGDNRELVSDNSFAMS